MGKILKFFREIGLDFTPQPGEGQWGGGFEIYRAGGRGISTKEEWGGMPHKRDGERSIA